MSDRFHLFAYGTLRSRADEPGRTLLRDCEPVAEAVVKGSLYDLDDYPALVLAGDGAVAGTIWSCPADLLGRLDGYEDVAGGLFRRVGLRVEGRPCWVYVAGMRLGPELLASRRVA